MTAARLSNGSPWLVEGTIGRGHVAVAATSLDTRDGNLPTLQAFLPLVHGLVYHLAENTRWELNYPSGRVVLRLPTTPRLASTPDAEANVPVEITAPDGSRIHVLGRSERQAITVTADHLFMPGLYRVTWPDAEDGLTADGGNRTVPFTVTSNPEESFLKKLSDHDRDAVQEAIHFDPLTRREDLLAIGAGHAHGLELWKSLMFLAAVVAVGEVGLTWWISLHRIPPIDETIDFTSRSTTASFEEELGKLRAAEDDRAGTRDNLDFLNVDANARG